MFDLVLREEEREKCLLLTLESRRKVYVGCEEM